MKLDRAGYDDYTEEGIRNLLTKELYITRNFNYKSELGNYINNNFLLGLNFDFQVNEKVTVYLNPTVSYSWFTIPDISVVVTDSLYSWGTSQRTEVESNFGFQINSGVKFKVSEQVKVNLQTSYYWSDHSYDVKGTLVNQNDELFNIRERGKDAFTALNFSIGLQFKLSKEQKGSENTSVAVR